MADVPINFYSHRYPFEAFAVDGLTSLLLHFDGSDGQTTTEDSSILNNAVELQGGVALSTDQFVFGPSSAYYTVSTVTNPTLAQSVNVPDLSAEDILAGDFTLETIVKFESFALATFGVQFFLWDAGTGPAAAFSFKRGNWTGFASDFPGGTVQLDNTLHFTWTPNATSPSQNRIYVSSNTFAILVDTWYYFAFSHAGDTNHLYAQDLTFDPENLIFPTVKTDTIRIHSESITTFDAETHVMRDTGGSPPSSRFNGWIEEFRISSTVRSFDVPINFYSRTNSNPTLFYSRST